MGLVLPSGCTVKLATYNSLGMTSETVQTMCLVTTVNATLHFVSLDCIVVVAVMLAVAVVLYTDSDYGEDRQDDQTLTAQFEDIIQAELDDEPTATDEHDIHIKPTTLHSLPDGLLEKVKAGDALSAQLITNETSNLAKCYMSIRRIFDGGKEYNKMQSGSFEGRCYAAGMRVQAGPTWQLETEEHIFCS